MATQTHLVLMRSISFSSFDSKGKQRVSILETLEQHSFTRQDNLKQKNCINGGDTYQQTRDICQRFLFQFARWRSVSPGLENSRKSTRIEDDEQKIRLAFYLCILRLTGCLTGLNGSIHCRLPCYFHRKPPCLGPLLTQVCNFILCHSYSVYIWLHHRLAFLCVACLTREADAA